MTDVVFLIAGLVGGIGLGWMLCKLVENIRQTKTDSDHKVEIASLKGQLDDSKNAENILKEAKTIFDEKTKDAINEFRGLSSHAVSEVDKSIKLLTESNRRAGSWGEMQLVRVAELAGMSKHCDFEVQVGTDSRHRIDMLVSLPNDLKIIVDAKASLQAFREANEVEKEKGPDAANEVWKKHAGALLTQVNGLASKDYPSRVQKSLGVVMMFVPGDQFLAAALSANRELIDIAAGKNIFLVTPVSLIAMLRAIEHGWQRIDMKKNAEKIAEAGNEMYERVADFVKQFGSVGDNIRLLVKAYNASVDSYRNEIKPTGDELAELVGEKDFKHISKIGTSPQEFESEGEGE